MKDEIIKKLKDYFKERREISFVYLFGSVAQGTAHSESDVDIGVYFIPKTGELEYESDTEYEEEDSIWLDLERMTSKKTDMVVLNRAPSTLIYSVIKKGQKIFSRDENFLLRLFLAVSSAAEDFREFVGDFVKIRERSYSLNDIDKERLERVVSFIEQEIADFKLFETIDQKKYQSDLPTKRNIERWAENIVNASIDIGKIILASEKKQIPDTYRLILEQLGSIGDFDQKIATDLASYSKMRNLLAHEYLDMRFAQLQKFVKNSKPAYEYLVKFIKKLLSEK